MRANGRRTSGVVVSVAGAALLGTAGMWVGGMLGAVPSAAQTAARAHTSSADPWWKHAVIYEIYPRSFQDSNGDGIGDLNGITARLDYVKDLGIDAIWITPMFPSPQVDFGYDVSDFEAVDPKYGTMADMDRLLTEANKRDVRVCLDFVVNHTSDKHKWFLESKSSRNNPKRDWYIWRDPKGFNPDGTPIPPNNWLSEFGHSAWKYDGSTKQFYYHRFYAEQPDLNWRNPQVEKAMFDVVRFWLNRGVAGFRLDAVPTMFENPNLPNAKELPGKTKLGDQNQENAEYEDLPEVHGVMRRLRTLVDSYPGNRVLIGETYLDSTAALNKWYGGAKHDELQLPMDLRVGFPKTPGTKLDAVTMRRQISDAETKLNGNQPLLVFDNHDNPRSWDRLGDGAHDPQIARGIAAILLTTKDAALTYYGAELGMYTATPKRVEDVQDPVGRTGWPQEKGRDGERTPMQWTPGPQAGFSTDPHTWLPVEADYKTVNVQTQSAEKASLFNWYKQLIALRRTNPALRSGTMGMLDPDNAAVLSYARRGPGGKSVVVSVNLSAQPQTVSLASAGRGKIKTVLTDAPSLEGQTSLAGIALPPYASWVGSID